MKSFEVLVKPLELPRQPTPRCASSIVVEKVAHTERQECREAQGGRLGLGLWVVADDGGRGGDGGGVGGGRDRACENDTGS